MAKASALLTSVRRTWMHPPELLSVRQAWSKMDHSSYQDQLRAAPTVDGVTALSMAHDEAQDPMSRPTPTAAIAWATAAGMEAPGVAATMVVAVVTVGVATPTTAEEETVGAEEARLVEVVARAAVRILDEATGAVAAALGEAAVDDETARGVVPLVPVPLSARLRLQARTAARSLW